MEDTQRKAAESVVSQLVERIQNHLSPGGIRDQLAKIKSEGLWPYLQERFLKPIQLSFAIARDRSIVETREYEIDMQAMGSLLILSANSKFDAPKGFSREGPQFELVATRLVLPPDGTKLRYRYIERPPHELFVDDIIGDQMAGHFLMGTFFPSIYDWETKRLSNLGVAEIREGNIRTIVEFDARQDMISEHKGGVFVATSGEVIVLNDTEMQGILESAQGVSDGYLVQGTWYLENGTYQDVLDSLNKTHVFHEYNAIGILKFEDGSERLFFVDGRERALFPLIGRMADRLLEISGAISWRLVGMEFYGGGIEFLRDPKLFENLGVDPQTISATRASFVYDDKQIFKFMLDPGRADIFEIYIPVS